MGSCVQHLPPSIPFDRLQAHVPYSVQHIQHWMPHLLAQSGPRRPVKQTHCSRVLLDWAVHEKEHTEDNLKTSPAKVLFRVCSKTISKTHRQGSAKKLPAQRHSYYYWLIFAKGQLPGLLWPNRPMQHSKRLEPSGKYPRATVQTGSKTRRAVGPQVGEIHQRPLNRQCLQP